MEDIYSPTVVSRVLAYPNIAAYEVLLHNKNKSLMKALYKDWNFTSLQDSSIIDYSLASITAFSFVAKKLVFSEYKMDSFMEEVKQKATEKGISENRMNSSIQYGDSVAKEIMKWVSKDNYAEVRGSTRYTLKQTDSTWSLTPPNYEPAMDPNWHMMRPLVMDSASACKPDRPIPYSGEKNSLFYNLAKAVIDTSKTLSDEQKNIALYWDDNPNEYISRGHNMTFSHKISPPCHWMNIAIQIFKLNQTDLMTCTKTYCQLAIGIYDGILSCWEEKFRSEVIRPVTYINRFIDDKWSPFIQTPPFPEYTSGHSVTSGAAATILEHQFGAISFSDSTEIMFGMKPRTFESPMQAANEASMSRFYGGIHYIPAISVGLNQGKEVGQHCIDFFTKNNL